MAAAKRRPGQKFFLRSPKDGEPAIVSPAMMALMLPEETDDDLVAAASRGDALAFARLVSRHYAFVHRVAWRWCGRSADADDIAQDVCLRLGRTIRGYRGDAAFTTWLYRLTLNAARDAGRKSAREQAKTAAFGAQMRADGEAGPAPDDRAERLWEAVRTLPDKQRDAVLLVHGEGLNHAAASAVMGVSESTVSWHIHEARKRLRVLLAAGEG